MVGDQPQRQERVKSAFEKLAPNFIPIIELQQLTSTPPIFNRLVPRLDQPLTLPSPRPPRQFFYFAGFGCGQLNILLFEPKQLTVKPVEGQQFINKLQHNRMAPKLTALFLASAALLVSAIMAEGILLSLSSTFFSLTPPAFQTLIVNQLPHPAPQIHPNPLPPQRFPSNHPHIHSNTPKRLLLSADSETGSEPNFQIPSSANAQQAKIGFIKQINANTKNNNGFQTPVKTSKNYEPLQNTQAKQTQTAAPTPNPFPALRANPRRESVYRTLPLQTPQIDYQQRDNAVRWRTIVNEELEKVSSKMTEEYNYYEHKYQISSYEQLPFCIVVPTYNNQAEDRYLRNMRSIVMQNYSNYHLVVIDDASTDATGSLIAQFLQEQNYISHYNYELIRNQEQKKAMHNLRAAALHHCRPDDIFLIVDGDDELLGRQVLKLFNSVFQRTGAWFVYSNFIFSNGNIGYSRPFPSLILQDDAYRHYYFVTSHLRAFYTQLFLNIREQDLRNDKGHYFSAANDVAICIPVLQQAHKRVSYLPELTYYYNSNTGQNNHIIRAFQQQSNDRFIRTKPTYAPLQQLFPKQHK